MLSNNLTVRGNESITLNGSITNSGGDRTLTVNLESGETATLNGAVNLTNDGTARILTITNNTVDTPITVNGTIQNGGAGAGGLTKSGNGVVIVNGTNTYTGQTLLTGGILKITSTSALGTIAGDTQINGGMLQIQGGLTIAENLTLNAGTYFNLGGLGVFDEFPGVSEITTLTGTFNALGPRDSMSINKERVIPYARPA